MPIMIALHFYDTARCQRINQKLLCTNFSEAIAFIFLCKMSKENKRHILNIYLL